MELSMHPLLGDGILLLDFAYRIHKDDKRFRHSSFRQWLVAADAVEQVQFLLARSAAAPEVVLLVIPGTNERPDWRLNLNPARREIPGFPGYFRAGFYEGAELLWGPAERLARDRWGLRFYSGAVKLVVIGHSLGGSIAGAYGGLLAARCPRLQADLLTLSCPRYCSAEAAQALGQFYPPDRGQRWLLDFDVVPHSVLPLGWRHALAPRVVGSDGVVRGKQRFRRELGNAVRASGFQPIERHLMPAWMSWRERQWRESEPNQEAR